MLPITIGHVRAKKGFSGSVIQSAKWARGSSVDGIEMSAPSNPAGGTFWPVLGSRADAPPTLVKKEGSFGSPPSFLDTSVKNADI